MGDKKIRRSDYCRNCMNYEREEKAFARGACTNPERPHIETQKRVVEGPAHFPVRQSDTCRLFVMRKVNRGVWLKTKEKHKCPKNGEELRHPGDTIDLVLPCFVDKRCECLGGPIFMNDTDVAVKCYFPDARRSRGTLLRYYRSKG